MAEPRQAVAFALAGSPRAPPKALATILLTRKRGLDHQYISKIIQLYNVIQCYTILYNVIHIYIIIYKIHSHTCAH